MLPSCAVAPRGAQHRPATSSSAACGRRERPRRPCSQHACAARAGVPCAAQRPARAAKGSLQHFCAVEQCAALRRAPCALRRASPPEACGLPCGAAAGLHGARSGAARAIVRAAGVVPYTGTKEHISTKRGCCSAPPARVGAGAACPRAWGCRRAGRASGGATPRVKGRLFRSGAMGGTASSHLEGDGGCYSVKCRSAPLSVNDRAVLRVTKQARGLHARPGSARCTRADPCAGTCPCQRVPLTAQELRVLAHVTAEAVHDATLDVDRDILLRLQWRDIPAVALAGRFLTITQAPPDGASRPTARAAQHARAAALPNRCSADTSVLLSMSLPLLPPGRCTCSSCRRPRTCRRW